jgi:hypothetical protein
LGFFSGVLDWVSITAAAAAMRIITITAAIIIVLPLRAGLAPAFELPSICFPPFFSHTQTVGKTGPE